MNHKNIRRTLENLMGNAAESAEQAREAVQNAGRAVSEKYDAMKLRVHVATLEAEIESLYGEIGMLQFFIKTGVTPEDMSPIDADKTPEQAIDLLIVSVQELQKIIATIEDELTMEKAGDVCPLCGRMCDENDAFCAVCGTKLS